VSDTPTLQLSGQRFKAVYRLAGTAEQARAYAHDICLEQTVEFPEDLIERTDIRQQIFGRVESFVQIDSEHHEATIAFPIEVAGGELPQLLNVLFGNISLKPGYRLVGCEFPESLLRSYRGPRFGRTGLRDLLGVHDRPLLSTAIKPMGLSPGELAEYAGQFARGGIDLIKDDHGLADQSFVRFEERVQRLSEAVARANQETGWHCLYLPNVTAGPEEMWRRARMAKSAGAGGLLIAPGLAGWDAMRRIADDDEIALPIMSHPAFLGGFTASLQDGIAHGVLYGPMMRLAGADATIFPNYGGRFSFSESQCREIMDASATAMHHVKPIFPAPAGGMKVERVAELCRFYGRESVLLIGGDLHRHGPDLAENCRQFAQLVRQNC
jgi:ribulose-bisphosphate carboxylase large chain